MSIENKTVLVLGATGKQGFYVCEELRRAGFRVVGCNRSGKSSALTRIGVSVLPFQFGSRQSIDDTIRSSRANYVYFFTDTMGAAKGKVAVDIEHGHIIVDACKAANIEHVIFSSVLWADTVGKEVAIFDCKLPTEKYLFASGLSASVLRPAAFFEGLDDPQHHNALTKGVVKDLWAANARCPWVSGNDIGKGAVAIFRDPMVWNGKILNAVGCAASGHEVADALTAVSGVKCIYKPALPTVVLYWFMYPLYQMKVYIEKCEAIYGNAEFDRLVTDFKRVVPDSMGPADFFRHKGQWANGEKFKNV